MEETMQDFEKELEKSYEVMGDGENNTDELLAWEKAKEYMESGEILSLEITGVVNKGVIVMVEGVLRGFVPASKLSLKKVEDLNDWLGKTVRLKVVTCDKDENKLVLSAREILKEERADEKRKKLDAVEVGAVMTGKVDSIKDYGAFIDLGDGLSGLLHVSQIANKRVKHPSDELKEGQEVTVKVTQKKDGKLSLSMKALLDNSDSEDAEPREKVVIPKAENIGTSLGSILQGLKLD
ncbi:MAG: S1 RNA-binding domain-containing protein [Eubacterium sp.]|nr:S1 RNA-binding domain-containing protein [Eubacterium sp.]